MGLVDLFGSLKGFVDVLKTLPQSEGLGYTLRYLARGSPLVLRLVTLLATIASVGFGYVSYVNLTEANSSLVSALTSPWDKSELPHSGLEAFLVASLLSPADWQALADLENAKVRPSFSDGVQRLGATLSAVPKRTSTTIDAINIPFRHKDPGADLFLSDREQGFLFVPGIQLTDPATLQSKLRPHPLEETDPNNAGVRRKSAPPSLSASDEPSLFTDIVLAQAAASELCGNADTDQATLRDLNSRDGASVFEKHPAILDEHFSQAYLIFQSGVSRLCESRVPSDFKAQRKFYGTQFKPYTLLQERPYFQGSLSKSASRSDSTVGEYFFESGPYMDIAGNGIVDTFCRALPVSAKREALSKPAGNLVYKTDAVLCVDFNVTKKVETSLAPRISRYGGTAAIVRCEEAHCSKEGEPEKPTFFSRDGLLGVCFSGEPIKDSDVNFIESKVRELQRASSKSEILGRIGTFPLDRSRVLFTVPMGQDKLLIGKLNLAAYQTRTFILLTIAGVAISATILLLFVGVADYGVKFREQQRAFEAVDKVMTGVNLPYIRVDENGHLIHMNDASATHLGFPNAGVAIQMLSKLTFEEMLADSKSVQEYMKIKEERARGEDYRSYLVKLRSGIGSNTNSVTEFQVHGWNVPTPRVASGKPGQSFGILIPTGN